MSLKSRIDNDIKDAMRAKDQNALRTLRSIKSMLLLAETEKGGSRDLSEADEMKLLTKAAKQRKESLETFAAQGREDLANKEQVELEIIEQYLPKAMTEEELKSAINKIITEEGAAGMQDMGKVMGRATNELAGRADGKQISQIVRQSLNH
ncbi:GatB/YqeY domain-containing protein [Catalinimonas niigatensis]|uniref:GatB/YqeY domain-containing protein n=1 Tax=Catalinimonas niigatensis TaxID=1397264 RepID=UPI00266544FC|nr:GatB/YqeY domain-containing protein [Catalinimonas niigatensis]WPP53485.1 GatB/YqeY domain-containing protein [Catalinimonas niigatensis]